MVESDEIGPRMRVWAFAHVMEGAQIGQDCNIGEHAYIESGVRLGNNVTVKNGVALWAGVSVEDDVFSARIAFSPTIQILAPSSKKDQTRSFPPSSGPMQRSEPMPQFCVALRLGAMHL